MASMPLRMMLYVFIGSEPENGGLMHRNNNVQCSLNRDGRHIHVN